MLCDSWREHTVGPLGLWRGVFTVGTSPWVRDAVASDEERSGHIKLVVSAHEPLDCNETKM